MAQTAQLRKLEVVENEAQRIFLAQREAFLRQPYPSLEERIENLRKLERILLEHADAICEAVRRDFGHRCAEETKTLEIFGCVDGLRYTRKMLKKWMRPQRRKVSPMFFPGKNWVLPQPKGVVGIISPWNYPVFLTISPLTSVLAAGNRAMIKMASNSQTVCRLLAEKFRSVFPEDTVAILPGVRPQEFTTLPFDHLIFTGSADAGKTVMRTAAEHLTPVTLELGGKSPTIICDDFDLEEAAERILYGKYINAGQTCLAPDYLFVPAPQRDRFVEVAKRIMSVRYPDPNDESYTSIIDDRSYRRLRATLEDAERKGAKIVPLVPQASYNDVLRKIPPTLVLDPTDDMIIMQQEIFGPLFPVKTYQDLDEVIAYINERDRPLGLYIFTNDRAKQERVLYRTLSGGVTINHVILHVAQHDLPFGGIGASGMGQYHAYEGFLEFSKLRPVFHAPRFSLLRLMYPPYRKFHRKMVDWLLRFGR
ncbi:MAG: putative coniferyl aldehyde dehydrogenase [Candidatus Binatia bacterium]|nr:MAG: putative coniferyl aldehyde dehydrogenase [Candidatus Binatia bacterium]